MKKNKRIKNVLCIENIKIYIWKKNHKKMKKIKKNKKRFNLIFIII
jgi:hypothetical protein